MLTSLLISVIVGRRQRSSIQGQSTVRTYLALPAWLVILEMKKKILFLGNCSLKLERSPTIEEQSRMLEMREK